MPDLITIQGDATALRSLDDIPTLEIIADTARRLDEANVVVAAFADEAAQTTLRATGLTVVLIATEAEYEAQEEEVFSAINNVPYDFSRLV